MWYFFVIHLLLIPHQMLFVLFDGFTFQEGKEERFEIIKLKKNITDGVCEMCNMSNVRPVVGNSTPRDAILTTGFSSLLNSIPFARSMRTCGCNARLIIFIDKDVLKKFSERFFSKLNDCGVELFLFTNYTTQSAVNIRYRAYRQFIAENSHCLNRIITIDLFDTMIQYDPFIPSFTGDTLYFQPEGFSIKDEENNRRWFYCVHDVFHKSNNMNHYYYKGSVDELLTKPAVNGGEVAGGPRQMLTYIDYLYKFLNACTDQGFMTYLYNTGAFTKEFDFPVVLLPWGNDIFTCVGRNVKWTNELDYFKKMKSGEYEINGSYPGLIHQYDRSREMTYAIVDACPNNYVPQFDQYFRTNNFECNNKSEPCKSS